MAFLGPLGTDLYYTLRPPDLEQLSVEFKTKLDTPIQLPVAGTSARPFIEIGFEVTLVNTGTSAFSITDFHRLQMKTASMQSGKKSLPPGSVVSFPIQLEPGNAVQFDLLLDYPVHPDAVVALDKLSEKNRKKNLIGYLEYLAKRRIDLSGSKVDPKYADSNLTGWDVTEAAKKQAKVPVKFITGRGKVFPVDAKLYAADTRHVNILREPEKKSKQFSMCEGPWLQPSVEAIDPQTNWGPEFSIQQGPSPLDEKKAEAPNKAKLPEQGS